MSTTTATTTENGVVLPSVAQLLSLPYGIRGGEEFKVVANAEKNKLSCVHFHLGESGGVVPQPHRRPNGIESSDISIVFAHATGFHKEVWYPVIEDLAKALNNLRNTQHPTLANVSMDILAIDAPGHGDSDPRKKYAWRRMMRDTLDVLDTTGFSTATRHPAKIRIGVGHSMGGAVLASAEAFRPNTFTHLILIEPIILPPAVWKDPVTSSSLATGAFKRRAWVEDIETARKGYKGRRVFKGWDDRSFEAYLHYGYFNAVIKEAGQTKSVKMLKCLPHQEASTFLGAMDIFDPMVTSPDATPPLASEKERREREEIIPVDLHPYLDNIYSTEFKVKNWHNSLARVKVPLKLVAGGDSGKDGGQTKEFFEFISTLFSHSTFHALEGLTHMAPMQDPKLLVDDILLPTLEQAVRYSRDRHSVHHKASL